MSATVFFYLVFFTYLATFRYPATAGLYSLLAVVLYVSNRPKLPDVAHRKKLVGIGVILLLNVLLIPVVGANWRELAFLVYILFLALALENTRVDMGDFLTFINVTYIVYALLSYLVYFGVFNAGFRDEVEQLNQFNELYFETWITTLIGYDGGTGGIDAYSMLVLILNFAYRKGRRESWFMIVLTLVNTLWTLRLTPWAMVLIPLLVVALPKSISRRSTYILVFLIFVSFLFPMILQYFATIDEVIFGLITHGRSDIWGAYADIMSHAPWLNMLFGFREHDLPFVEVWGGTTLLNNPHSSYLRILLSFGVVLYALFYLFMSRRAADVEDRRSLFIMMAVLVAAITSDVILYNHNPVFLFTFFVLAARSAGDGSRPVPSIQQVS